MRWMMARMMVRAARIVKEIRAKDRGAAAVAPIKLLQKERHKVVQQRAQCEHDADTVAAKKFAAAEAERAAHAQSDADKLSALAADMAELQQQQKEMIALLRGGNSARGGGGASLPRGSNEPSHSRFEALEA